MTAEKIISHIKAREWISLNALEKKLGIPQSTLSKAVNGERALPKKWVKPLAEELGVK